MPDRRHHDHLGHAGADGLRARLESGQAAQVTSTHGASGEQPGQIGLEGHLARQQVGARTARPPQDQLVQQGRRQPHPFEQALHGGCRHGDGILSQRGVLPGHQRRAQGIDEHGLRHAQPPWPEASGEPAPAAAKPASSRVSKTPQRSIWAP